MSVRMTFDLSQLKCAKHQAHHQQQHQSIKHPQQHATEATKMVWFKKGCYNFLINILFREANHHQWQHQSHWTQKTCEHWHPSKIPLRMQHNNQHFK